MLSRFGEYQFETGVREDPEWSTYLNFLRPGALDFHRIMNRRVCEALERHGDKLASAREIDHWSYLPSQDALGTDLAEVTAMGFRVRAKSISDEGTLRFGAQVWRTDVPDYDRIDEITIPLFEAAVRHGGEYEGWECPVDSSTD